VAPLDGENALNLGRDFHLEESEVFGQSGIFRLFVHQNARKAPFVEPQLEPLGYWSQQ
jgi:hypothetical protein